jgi:4-amino-4-deoxy-L-arabinose transferase-like glycosyltransferase
MLMLHSIRRAILPRALQILLWFSAISLFAWALIDLRFRDAEGFLEGSFSLPVAVGVALLILGWAVSNRWRRFAFWLALALVGQAVALQMIDAGSALGYQHYRTLGRLLTETPPWLLIYLAAQTALVVAGFAARWSRIRVWLDRTFRPWQLIGVGLIFFLSAATVSPQVPVYITELFLAALVQTVNLGNIVLIAWAFPHEELAWLKGKLETLFGSLKPADVTEPGGLDRFAMLAAVWVIVLAAVLSYYSYERHPHVTDEFAYLYQARYLAAGVLTMPAPPVQDAFQVYLMQVDGDRWYPSPPPGWPAMLAIGVRLRAPWLVNPVLAGLNVLLIYMLLRELYSRRMARLALILAAISPWYIFMAMNFMTHTFTLTCALVASLGVAWTTRTGKVMWSWLGGVALGMMALIRPLEAIAMAGLLGLWAIGIGGQRLKISAIVGLVLAAVLVGSSTFLYNQMLTGNATLFPIMAYTEQHFGPNSNALGFGPDRGMGWPIDPWPGHSPRDALVNANLNTFSVNIELFGWSIGSLILVAVMVFAGRLRQSDYLMLAVIAVIFGLHFFYYFSGGPDFGARYWFLMFVPLLALTARGIQLMERRFGVASSSSSSTSPRVMVAVLSLCFLTLVNYIPWRAVDKYHHYLNMRPDIRYLADEQGFGSSLVLIQGDMHPDYTSAAIYNPLDLHASVPVYAWDRNPQVRAAVLRAYPDRPVWIVEGPTLTQEGFRVVEGPLSAQKLIKPK